MLRLILPYVVFARKVEAFIQFFLGYYAEDLTYKDDFFTVFRKNISAVTGFWFDCVTSIPWSFMDIHFYLVWQVAILFLLLSSKKSSGRRGRWGSDALPCRFAWRTGIPPSRQTVMPELFEL
jgi:hypothetical protein